MRRTTRKRQPVQVKSPKKTTLRGRRPHWQDVQQLLIGNCYLLAVLKGLALRNPDIINQIIWDNPDGKTVTVRLFQPVFSPDGASIQGHHPVEYVLKKKLHLGKQNWHHAPWVYYVEDAYEQHRRQLYPEKYRGKSRAAVLSSGHAHDSYRHLLGVDSHYSVVSHAEVMKSKMQGKDTPFCLDDSLLMEYESFAQVFAKEDETRKLIQKRIVQAAFNSPDVQSDFLNIFKHEDFVRDFIDNFSFENYQRFYDFIFEKRTDKDLKKLSVILPKIRIETLLRLIEHLNGMANNLLNQTVDEVYDRLYKVLSSGEFVSAATLDKKMLSIKKIVPLHVYHVLNVFKMDDGRKYVVLENPWGRSVPKSPKLSGEFDAAIKVSAQEQNEVGSAKGVFVLSMSEFVENFDYISFTGIKNTIIKEQKEFAQLESQIATQRDDINKLFQKYARHDVSLDDDAVSQVSIDSERDDVVSQISFGSEQDDDAVSIGSGLSGSEREDSHYSSVILPSVNVLSCNQEKLSRVEDRVTFLHNIAINSTVARNVFTQDPATMLPKVKLDLERYLKYFDQKSFSEKNYAAKWSHRLFSKSSDRYISQSRRDRANTLLALIDAYDKVEGNNDKNVILRLILDIKNQHQKEVSRISRFHGNRLGKLLSSFDNLQVQDNSATLSFKGGNLLGRVLREHGFNSSNSKVLLQQANGLMMTDAIECSLAYERYKGMPEKKSVAHSAASLFASSKSAHQVDFLSGSGEEPIHSGFGSSFS